MTLNRYSAYYDHDEERVKHSIAADGDWVHIKTAERLQDEIEELKAKLAAVGETPRCSCGKAVPCFKGCPDCGHDQGELPYCQGDKHKDSRSILDTVRTLKSNCEHSNEGQFRVHLTEADYAAFVVEIKHLRSELALAEQVSGELCHACGWAMKFPGEPCRCELLTANDKLRTALELAEVDVSLARTWCRICRTEDSRRDRSRASHPHAKECLLYREQ